ncbi:MAG: hypothetical protein ACI4UM_09140 [Succinivibrio sp.]
MRAFCCLLLMAMLLGACTSGNEQLNLETRSSIEKHIIDGRTTKSQVYDYLGMETYIEKDPDTEANILVYSFSVYKTILSNYAPIKCTTNYPSMNKKLRIWLSKKDVVTKHEFTGTFYILHRGCLWLGERIMNERELEPSELDSQEIPEDY